MQPSDVTASTISSVSNSWQSLPSSSIGCQAPVEVSHGRCRAPWAGPFATSREFGQDRKHRPRVFRESSVRRPVRPATSIMRWPKKPLLQTTMRSPGSMRLTTQVSMPAMPVVLTGKVRGFLVLIGLPQHLLGLEHDFEKVGIEMAEQWRGHRRRARADGHRWDRAKEQTRGAD